MLSAVASFINFMMKSKSRRFTAETLRARRRGFSVKDFSELSELCVSVVKSDARIFTAETLRTLSKEILIKTFSDLCVLCASVVKFFSVKYAA